MTTKKNKVRIGPTTPNQALAFKRAKEVDLLIIGGNRGKY